MPWNSTAPDGTKSVKDNRSLLGDNTTYVETTQKVNHYWNEGANDNGNHRYVVMPVITSSGCGVDPNKDPTSMPTGQTCMIYTRKKTATESPGAQYDEPYVFTEGNSINQYMQFGFRALCHCDGRSTAGACTINYAHNITSVTKTATIGQYSVTFTKDLPSTNYIITGSSLRTGADNFLYLAVVSQAASGFTIRFQYSGNNKADPDKIMFMVVGG